ncbi:unnamed protein product [Caenorhabditis angaria]|uniref:DUF4708 domain-containing protein n=1 Tax=Caenorhabditis angaria TaxID=860376 RepID=A0A9P1MVY2_9PELO|nr:unnamed protein product [Caenorhabditis angaria]
MCSTILSLGKLKMKDLKSYYLQIDMEFDNRKNCPHAMLNKLCRDLLSLAEGFGGCFAEPQNDLSTIHLISKQETIDSERFKDFFKDQRIFIKLENPCDGFSIEKCFKFTFIYYMEKMKWFKMSDSLVQHGFLSWKLTNLPRICIKVHCTSESEIFVKFDAEFIRIFPFEHWLLEKSERFDEKAIKTGPISKTIKPRWVTCLPKLGRGQIIKIHRKIPTSSPFESYNEIKAYWKNTCGYILPAEEPEVYYEVLFQNGENMLYPFFCVLTGPPETMQVRMNAKQLQECLKSFLKDLENAKIFITGVQLKPIKKECQTVKRYLEVLSLPTSGRMKKVEKVSRSAEKRPASPVKIYPMQRKRRPGSNISVD